MRQSCLLTEYSRVNILWTNRVELLHDSIFGMHQTRAIIWYVWSGITHSIPPEGLPITLNINSSVSHLHVHASNQSIGQLTLKVLVITIDALGHL